MSHLATVAIISIGEMGMGIAKLLIAHNFRVVTNIEGRSAATHERATKSKIELLPSDTSLVAASDYIFSIVPPRDALATAKRITTAYSNSPKTSPLYYLDLNAISPRTAREIAAVFESSAPEIKLIDGGIIGGAPSPKAEPQATTTVSDHPTGNSVPGGTHPESAHAWNRPKIVVSGPHKLSESSKSGAFLAETMNLDHISPEIGPASGLKCCFASLSKGFTALCIQSFTTANNLGVLPLLQEQLSARMPGLLKAATGGVTGMPPKAYRWVREMEEIGLTLAYEGGFEGGEGQSSVFGEIAKVYKSVADESVLGKETTEKRVRGRTIEDVAEAMSEGLKNKKRKLE